MSRTLGDPAPDLDAPGAVELAYPDGGPDPAPADAGLPQQADNAQAAGHRSLSRDMAPRALL